MRFFRGKKPNHLKVILISIAVVLFWRGVWGLMDIFLFPQQPALSYLSSLVIGIFVLFITRNLLKQL